MPDLAPLGLRLENHGRLDHAQRRRIRGSLRFACLSKDAVNLGKLLYQLVLDLQILAGLGHGYPRQGDRHVENAPFVERRHELGAESLKNGDRRQEQQQRCENDKPFVIEDKPHGRPVRPHENPADRVALLAVNLPDQHGVQCPAQPSRAKRELSSAHEEQSQRRVQRDRQNGGDGHGKIFRESQGLEESPLLRLQREDRHE